MFYLLSKLFWLFAQPVSLLAELAVLALVFSLTRWRGVERALLSVLVVLTVLMLFTNIGQLAISPLEQRFHRPAQMPGAVAGAIVLGGGIDTAIARDNRSYELNAAGDRFVEGLRLALDHPDFKIVVTGGVGSFGEPGDGDGIAGQRFFDAFNVPRSRLLFESQSQNTYQNAVDTKALLSTAEIKRPWLLITSAYHMPRALDVFRTQGFDVVPWPVDYRAPQHPMFRIALADPDGNLTTLTVALKEWTGLLAYWLSGRTSELLPK